MNTEFEALSNRIFQNKADDFKRLNAEHIGNLLRPLGENLKDFREKVEQVYNTEAKERFLLGERIKDLVELNNRLSEEANNLTRALKGDSKMQGNWGEVILERLLQASGLIEGEHYVAYFNDSETEKERSRHKNGFFTRAVKRNSKTLRLVFRPATGDKEVVAVKPGPEREESAYASIRDMRGIVLYFFFLVLFTEHDNGGIADHEGKEQLHIRAEGEEPRTDSHKNGTKDNSSENAPVKNSMPEGVGDGKPRENSHNDKKVVNRQHLFQHIASEKEAGHIAAMMDIEIQAEGYGNGNPEGCPEAGAFERHTFVAFMREQIKKQ